jgi:hypothetical protein
MLKLQKRRMVRKVLNESRMSNRRCQTPLTLDVGIRAVVYAQPLIPASVAYLFR